MENLLKGLSDYSINEYQKLEKPAQDKALDLYKKKKINSGSLIVLWMLGWHYAHMDRWLLQLLFLFACFIYIGWVWWILDAFYIYGRMKDRNEDIFLDIIKKLK